MRTYGFADGLYDENEMNSGKIKDKDSKLAYLAKIISVVELTNGTPIDIRPGKVAHLGEAPLMEMQPVAISVGKCGAAGDGVGVAVDGDDGAGGGVEDGLAIAAIAEGCVKIEAAIKRGQG